MNKKIATICCLLMGGAWFSQLSGQEAAHGSGQEGRIPNKERWAFKTNVVNWATLMPNIGVEYDLTGTVYNKWTLGAQVTWNGNTGVNLTQPIQVELNDYRVEARRYFKSSMKMKPGSRRTPRFWRTYYWGVYAGYTRFNLIWNKGVTGDLFQVGATGGWQVPIYQYKQGGLDLDLGFSVGMICSEYDRMEYKQEAGMMRTERHARKWTPYPVPTELRIGLVYRFNSIKYKYNKTKPTH